MSEITETPPKAAGSRSAARRQLIVDAALQHFMHYGFKGASLEEIAHAAGVSRPALYHHFASKEDLFRAIAAALHDQVIAKVMQEAEVERPIGERLNRMLAVKNTEVHETLWKSRHGGEVFDENNRLAADLATAYRRRYSRALGDTLQAAHTKGEIDLKRTGMRAQAAGAFLFFSAEGLHERFTGTPVSPAIYRGRLETLVKCFMAAVLPAA